MFCWLAIAIVPPRKFVIRRRELVALMVILSKHVQGIPIGMESRFHGLVTTIIPIATFRSFLNNVAIRQ
jgi:hypothetical protein